MEMDFSADSFVEIETKYKVPRYCGTNLYAFLLDGFERHKIGIVPFSLLTQNSIYLDSNNGILYKNNISLNIDDKYDGFKIRFKYLLDVKDNAGYFRELNVQSRSPMMVVNSNMFWLAPPQLHIKELMGIGNCADIFSIDDIGNGFSEVITARAYRRYFALDFFGGEFKKSVCQFEIGLIIDEVEGRDKYGATCDYTEIEIEVTPLSYGWEPAFEAVHLALVDMGFEPSYLSKYQMIRGILHANNE